MSATMALNTLPSMIDTNYNSMSPPTMSAKYDDTDEEEINTGVAEQMETTEQDTIMVERPSMISDRPSMLMEPTFVDRPSMLKEDELDESNSTDSSFPVKAPHKRGKRKKYQKYTPEDRIAIGKYCFEHGPAAARKAFQDRYPEMSESVTRGFRDKYKQMIGEFAVYEYEQKRQRDMQGSYISPPRGRPRKYKLKEETKPTELERNSQNNSPNERKVEYDSYEKSGHLSGEEKHEMKEAEEKSRVTIVKLSLDDELRIGRYCSHHGVLETLHEFHKEYPGISEALIVDFHKKYQELQKGKEEIPDGPSFVSPSQAREYPGLLLREYPSPGSRGRQYTSPGPHPRREQTSPRSRSREYPSPAGAQPREYPPPGSNQREYPSSSQPQVFVLEGDNVTEASSNTTTTVTGTPKPERRFSNQHSPASSTKESAVSPGSHRSEKDLSLSPSPPHRRYEESEHYYRQRSRSPPARISPPALHPTTSNISSHYAMIAPPIIHYPRPKPLSSRPYSPPHTYNGQLHRTLDEDNRGKDQVTYVKVNGFTSVSYPYDRKDYDHRPPSSSSSHGRSKRFKYQKYTPEDRYNIGKLCNDIGLGATVKVYREQFPRLNESVVRTFRNKYRELLEKGNGRPVTEAIERKPSRRSISTLMEGEVVSHLKELRSSQVELTENFVLAVARNIIATKHQKNAEHMNGILTKEWANTLLWKHKLLDNHEPIVINARGVCCERCNTKLVCPKCP